MAQSISQEAIGATGLPGATAASRHAGATTTGAPTTGTFAVGDFIVDQSGAMYVCTVAGTPGTWQLSGVSVNENIAGKNFIINGGMDIWQRGTTFSLTTANTAYYTADRWSALCTASGQATVSQVSPNITTTSTTSQVMTVNATVTITVGTGLIIAPGNGVQIYYAGNASGMNGTVTSYNSSTGVLVSYISFYWGTPGTYSSWTVTIEPIGFKYALRHQRNSASTGTGTHYVLQPLETINSIPLANQTVTVSFWAKAGSNYSASSSLLTANFFVGFGTDQSPYNSGYSGLTDIAAINVTLTTSWQRFSYSVTVNPSVTELSPGFSYAPTGTAGAADYFDITGVQLEIAPQATPFSRAGGSIGGELALCQRYYWQITGNASSITPIAAAFLSSTTTAQAYLQLPVTMRIAPTWSYSAIADIRVTWSAGTSVTSSLNQDITTPTTQSLRINTSGLTTGQGGYFLVDTGSSKYIAFSAEL